MLQRWTFSALDTLFFRDGTPYHAGEGGYTGVSSFFPPFITTLQGVIRTSLALDQGWAPGSPLPALLGDAESLGDLQMFGPYLYAGGRPHFPMPLNILRVSKAWGGGPEFVRLLPGDPVECDLGFVRLPVPTRSVEGAKSPEGQWVARAGLRYVLAGDLPPADEVLHEDKLWAEEPRVGLERDNITRIAVRGKLYNCVHVRPCKGTELVVLVKGVPDDWTLRRNRVARMGGEGRLAGVAVDRINTPEAVLPDAPGLKPVGNKLRFTVTLVTPGWYAKTDIVSVIQQGPPGVPGQCVAACVGKPELVGGWNLADNRPRPLHPVIPAGSTWFYESDDRVETVLDLHGRCLGGRSAFGFGQILIGRWDDSQ